MRSLEKTSRASAPDRGTADTCRPQRFSLGIPVDVCVTGAAPPGLLTGAAPLARGRILTLVLLVLVSMCLAGDRELMNVLSVQIMADLHISKTRFGLLNGLAFGLFYASFGIPIAMLADRVNRKWIVSTAVALWSGMTALCGSAGTFWQLTLARTAVAVGEAGGTPPSHSMLSDLYPATSRGRAFSLWTLGGPLGITAAIAVGGPVAAAWGWRAAFLVFGAAGVLLSIVNVLALREPPRGLAEDRCPAVREAAPLPAVLRFMRQQRSLVHLIIAGTVTSAVVSANATWTAAFLQYSHGFDLASLAVVLAPVLGGATLLGTLLGGYLWDKLGRYRVEWRARVAACAMLLATPFGFAIYLLNDRRWVLAMLFVPIAASISLVGPTAALVQGLVAIRMRAMASALVLLTGSIAGGSLGPFIVGVVADHLEPMVGRDSVRYALLGLSVFNLWAAAHFWIAGRTLRQDLQRAAEAS